MFQDFHAEVFALTCWHQEEEEEVPAAKNLSHNVFRFNSRWCQLASWDRSLWAENRDRLSPPVYFNLPFPVQERLDQFLWNIVFFFSLCPCWPHCGLVMPCEAGQKKSNPCILWAIHMEKDSGERIKQTGEGEQTNGVDWIIELRECSWWSIFIPIVLRSLHHHPPNHPPHTHTDPSTLTHPPIGCFLIISVIAVLCLSLSPENVVHTLKKLQFFYKNWSYREIWKRTPTSVDKVLMTI